MKNLITLIESLKSLNLDGIFIAKQANVNYISGFSDEAAYVLITKDKNFLLTDGRFYELAQSQCKNFEVINWQVKFKSLTESVQALCIEHNIKRLGFERESILYRFYDNIRNTLENIELVPTSSLIEDLRYIKNEEEVSNLREACSIGDKAFTELLNHIKPGLTEIEVAAKLEYLMKVNGADGIGFETILISGTKTSLPHGKPDRKIIQNGDFITIDFGALYKGYTSDMTRTIVVGKADQKQLEIYNLVKKAQEVGLSVINAGVLSNVPDKAIREVLKDYLEYYYPGIGHGVGRELHEEPFLSINGNREIRENCVITVEPGLYIPNWGGVRIEDTILVKNGGIEILTNSSKELIYI